MLKTLNSPYILTIIIASLNADLCLPDPCYHGGVCNVESNEAVCDCSGTTYTGERCQQALGNVSVIIEGTVHKGREQSMVLFAKPDNSLQIEVTPVNNAIMVTPHKVLIVHPNDRANVTLKGLGAGLETFQFSLSDIDAADFNTPENLTICVNDVFSRNNISDFTLPLGSFEFEANLYEQLDVVYKSTRPWYSLTSDSDIVFTLGSVHLETENLKMPISINGTEITPNGQPRPVSSYRTEDDGNMQSDRGRSYNQLTFMEEDQADLWAHNSIFRTALTFLKPHLPLWLSLEICGGPVNDVIPRIDIMTGLQTTAIHSCSSAPVFHDHLYAVLEIRTDMCVGILGDSVVVTATT